MQVRGKFFFSVAAVLSLFGLILYTQKTEDTLRSLSYSLINSFPDTPEKVGAYVDETISAFDHQLELFLSNQDRDYSNTIDAWDRIGQMLLERLITLKSLPIIQASEQSILKAEEGFGKIQHHVIERLTHTPKISLTFLSFLENLSAKAPISLAEWNRVYQLASSINSYDFPLVYKRKIDELQIVLASHDQTPYDYKKGKAYPKTINEDKGLTLLNWNVCFLPGKLPILFGGVLPWSLRIEKVTSRIEQLDPDIVCLQEVFEEKSALLLYEGLKERYTHFYLSIGPRNFGLSPSSLGLGSGLFVASKYPISNPSYHPFTDSQDYMKRGVFSFTLKENNQYIAHIYTSHLAAFNTGPSPSYRKKQLEQILGLIKEKNTDCPVLLCGDLNIPYNSLEPAEHLLKEHFINPYNKCHQIPCLENRTALDLTPIWWPAHFNPRLFNPSPEILDYSLLFKSGKPNSQMGPKFFLYTTTIPMNDIQDPLKALSDHHAQLSLINKVDPNKITLKNKD